MRAIDTNIVVRYLTADDAAQFAMAKRLIEAQAVFVPATVVLETAWVLRNKKFSRGEVIDLLVGFAGLPTVSVENEDAVADAFDLARTGLDFADAFHLVGAAACETMLTFDHDFARRGAGRYPVSVTLLDETGLTSFLERPE